MKVKQIFAVMVTSITLCGCQQQLGIGIKMENMNDSVAPGTDFYEYACGGWRKNNPFTFRWIRTTMTTIIPWRRLLKST